MEYPRYKMKSSELTKFLEKGDLFALGDKNLLVLHFPRAVQLMTCLAGSCFCFCREVVNDKQSRESRGLLISLPASPLANSLAARERINWELCYSKKKVIPPSYAGYTAKWIMFFQGIWTFLMATDSSHYCRTDYIFEVGAC